MLVQGAKGRHAIMYSGLLDVDYLLSDQATSATVITEVLPVSYLAELDPVIGRVTVISTGTDADVAAGNVVIEGEDLQGADQTDTLVFAANQATLEVGVKTFSKITKITFPVQDGAAATFDVGIDSFIDIEFTAQQRRLIEYRVIWDSAIAASENLVLAMENAIYPLQDINIHTTAANALVFSRKTDMKLDMFPGFKLHWTFTNTDDEPWAFLAIFETG